MLFIPSYIRPGCGDISEPISLAHGDSSGPLSAHLSPSTNQTPLQGGVGSV